MACACLVTILACLNALLPLSSFKPSYSPAVNELPITVNAINMATETDYVTLISNDGFSYVVQRSSACISPAIKKMLDPNSKRPRSLLT